MRRLLLSLACLTTLTHLFGKEAELPEETKVTLGKLVAETLRPTLLLGYKADALKYTHGEVDQATGIRILQEHASSVGLSAAHCEVINDEAKGPLVSEFSLRIGGLRRKQTAVCASLPTPDAAADFSKFILQSMYYKAFSKDEAEANQLVLGSAMANSLNYIEGQAKVAGDAAQFIESEKLVVKTLGDLVARHPSLERDPTFVKATNDLLAEHAERGKRAAKMLSSDPVAFYQGLLGRRSDRAGWNFSPIDKFISLTINSQKIFGACVCSDFQLIAQDGRSGQTRTLNFKVIHLAYKDGTAGVIDIY